MNNLNPVPAPPSTRQVLLGLFILGQCIFLISANFLGFLKDIREDMPPQIRQLAQALAPGWPEEKGHAWQLMEHVVQTDKMWAQVTGQLQSWSLFAPTVARECVFPAVEYRWEPGPFSGPALGQRLAPLAATNIFEAVWLEEAAVMTPLQPLTELVLSENEPANLKEYFRLGNFRSRRYENNLVIPLRPDEGEKDNAIKMKKRWSEQIRSHVASYADILHGYLRWRLAHDSSRWPARKRPNQVVLVLRRYYINDHRDAPPYWSGPYAVPLALWQPGVLGDDKDQPVEWYDPVSERFKSLAK